MRFDGREHKEGQEDLRCRIRQQALAARDALGEEERRRASLLMTERLLGHQWFYGSDRIFLFASFGSEISTWDLMEETLRLGKALYLPKVAKGPGNWEMQFYQVTDLSKLSPGYGNIPEPSGGMKSYDGTPQTAAHTLVLMPGAAFDREKNRLGYGKGFYDRFLAGRKELAARTIALGHRCQLVERIPEREGDVRPCQVLLF